MSTITSPGLDELTLPNHPETQIWLKRRPTAGDKNRVDAHAIVARREVAPGRYQTDPDGFAKYLVVKAMVMVHDWTVTDEAGKRVPISVEGYEALDPADGDFLMTEAHKRFEAGTSTSPLVTDSEPSSATE